jgi:hypothetical protein
MLGRLEMDVDECVSAYKDLMKAVLEEKLSRTRKLKSAFGKVITSRGLNQADLFNDGTARGFVSGICDRRPKCSVIRSVRRR